MCAGTKAAHVFIFYFFFFSLCILVLLFSSVGGVVGISSIADVLSFSIPNRSHPELFRRVLGPRAAAVQLMNAASARTVCADVMRRRWEPLVFHGLANCISHGHPNRKSVSLSASGFPGRSADEVWNRLISIVIVARFAVGR